MGNTIILYAVRDKSTGKFANDITNPRHKYWESKKKCETAINNYRPSSNKYSATRSRWKEHNKEDLEIVELVFKEGINND